MLDKYEEKQFDAIYSYFNKEKHANLVKMDVKYDDYIKSAKGIKNAFRVEVNRDLAPITEPKIGWKNTRRKNKALKRSKDAHTEGISEYGGYIMECETLAYTEDKVQWDERPEQLDMKAQLSEMMAKKYNPDMFKPEYFGKNYEIIMKDMFDMFSILEFYGEGNDGYKELNVVEQGQVRILQITYNRLMVCYEKALNCHGLTLKKGRVVKGDVPAGDADALRKLQFEQSELKKYMDDADNLSKEVELKARLEDEFDEEFDVGMEMIGPEVEKWAETAPLVEGTFFTPDAYTKIQKLYEALDSDTETVNRYWELTKMVLPDYVKSQKLFGENYILVATYDNILKRLKDENFDDPSKYTDPRLIHYYDMVEHELNMVKIKRDTYEANIKLLDGVFDNLIYGTKNLDANEQNYLRKYGYETQDENLKIFNTEGDRAACYARTYRAKEKAFKEAVLKKFPDADDENIKKYTVGSVGRAIMLIKPGYDAYNEKVIDLLTLRFPLIKLEQGIGKRGEDGVPIFADKRKGEDFFKAAADAYELTAEILFPKLDAVMDVDIHKYMEMGPAELVLHQEELTELSIADQMISDLCRSYSDEKEFTVLEKYLGKPPYKLKKENAEEHERKLAEFQVKLDLLRTKRIALNTLRNISRGYSLQTDGAVLADPNEVLMENDVDRMLGAYKEENTYAGKLKAHGAQLVATMKRNCDLNAEKLKDAEARAKELGIAEELGVAEELGNKTE